MRRRRIGFILIFTGFVMAAVAGIIVYGQVSQAQQIEAKLPTRDVVVARDPIPEKTVIQASSLMMVQVPEQAVPVGAAERIEDVADKISPFAIVKGEIIVLDKLAPLASRDIPSYALKKGMVAFTFPYKGEGSYPKEKTYLAASNMPRTGDRVDVLLTMLIVPVDWAKNAGSMDASLMGTFSQTRTILQNIEVLQVGVFSSASGQKPAGGQDEPYITLALTHQDAAILKWAKDTGGSVDFVVRSPYDSDVVEVPNITFDYMVRQFGFDVPSVAASASSNER